jgi:hypothetical protein
MNSDIEAVWLVIIPIIGILFIAIRLIYNEKLGKLGKHEKKENIDDILIYIILSFFFIVFFYGPSNPYYMSFAYTIFIIGLVVGVGMSIKYMYKKLFSKH